MAKFKVDVNAGEDHVDSTAAADEAHADEAHADTGNGHDDFMVKAATVGVIGVGVALIEAALIPGMIIGVAAALAPKYLPKLSDSVQPLFRSTIRNVYKFGVKARSAVAECQEHMHDIVAEVRAEDVTAASPAAPAAAAAQA